MAVGVDVAVVVDAAVVVVPVVDAAVMVAVDKILVGEYFVVLVIVDEWVASRGKK